MKSNVNYRKSDHFNDETFYNPWGNDASKGLWDVIKWKVTTSIEKWLNNDIANIYQTNLRI